MPPGAATAMMRTPRSIAAATTSVASSAGPVRTRRSANTGAAVTG